MKYSIPFYSASADKPATEVYHTHPQCRVGQKIQPTSRVEGMGEDRRECPFCYVLGQFSATKFVKMPVGTPISISPPALGGPTLAQ